MRSHEDCTLTMRARIDPSCSLGYWLVYRKRTLRVEVLEIADADGRVRGRFVAANGMVGLTLDDSNGRTRVGMFVNPSGQPGVTLFDDKERGRVSLEVVEVPEELKVSKEQLATFSTEELGRFANKHMPHRPMLVFVSEKSLGFGWEAGIRAKRGVSRTTPEDAPSGQRATRS